MAIKDAVKEKSSDKVKEPRQYHVIMFNDDFTTMEFVVSVLVDIFHKDQVTAHAIMMNVHKKGQAVVIRPDPVQVVRDLSVIVHIFPPFAVNIVIRCPGLRLRFR